VSGTLAGIAIVGASASIGQNGGVLAAALGGVLVLNWPKRRFLPSATGRILSFTVLAALLCQMMLFTKAPVWSMVIILPAFFGGRLFDLWFPHDFRHSGSRAATLRPVFIGAVSAILAAAVFGVALTFSPPLDPYAG